VIRLIAVAVSSILLILFVAFIVSRLVRTRSRGMSIRMQVFLALAVIVGAFAFGLGIMVIDRIEARARARGAPTSEWSSSTRAAGACFRKTWPRIRRAR
jgi:hypothetical protein